MGPGAQGPWGGGGGLTGGQASRRRQRGFSTKQEINLRMAGRRWQDTDFPAESYPSVWALPTHSQGCRLDQRTDSFSLQSSPAVRRTGCGPVLISTSFTWVPWPWEKDCPSTAGSTPPHTLSEGLYHPGAAP